MLISYRRQFIFIHVPKAAGLSISRALTTYAHQPERFVVYRPLRKFGFQGRLPFARHRFFHPHVTAAQLGKQLDQDIFQRFFKFAFVRNPWDREVSLYHFIRQNKRHPHHKIVKAARGFNEFVAWRISSPVKQQKEFVTDSSGRIIVDFVGRYERLEADFQHVCMTLGVCNSLPHRNSSVHHDFRSYYDSRMVRLIRDAYCDDIDLFGYTFDDAAVA